MAWVNIYSKRCSVAFKLYAKIPMKKNSLNSLLLKEASSKTCQGFSDIKMNSCLNDSTR